MVLEMNIISELMGDAKKILHYRKQITSWQHKHEPNVPNVAELATDFTLRDTTGEHPVTLSDFRGKKPVALVFGSYT